MNEEQIEKLEGLKQQMRIKQQKQRLQNNTLLQECLAAIKPYTIIEDEEEIKHIIHLVSLPEVEMHSLMPLKLEEKLHPIRYNNLRHLPM